MNKFKRLTAEALSKYKELNEPEDFQGQVDWYMDAHVIDYGTHLWEEAWSVLAFLSPVHRPDVLTLYTCEYDEELVDPAVEDLVEDYQFDALQEGSNGIVLNQTKYEDLIALLKLYRKQLADSLRQEQTFFKSIKKSEWSHWHINHIEIPGFDDVFAYFQQIHNPLQGDEPDSPTTLIEFCRGRNDPKQELSLRFYCFPYSDLENPDHKLYPGDSNSYINLDREAIDKFIELLEYHWHYLASPSF